MALYFCAIVKRPSQYLWITKTAKLFALFILSVACLGLVYQWAVSIYDRQLSPPSGKLIDIGGFRMHLDCLGQGTPTVVMDSGVSDSSLSWHKIQPQISEFKISRVPAHTTVRAWLERSEPGTSHQPCHRPGVAHTSAQRSSIPAARAGRPFDGWVRCAHVCESLPIGCCRSGACGFLPP